MTPRDHTDILLKLGELISSFRNLELRESERFQEIKDVIKDDLGAVPARMIDLEVGLAEVRAGLKSCPSFRQVLIFLGTAATIGIAAFTLYEVITKG